MKQREYYNPKIKMKMTTPIVLLIHALLFALSSNKNGSTIMAFTFYPSPIIRITNYRHGSSTAISSSSPFINPNSNTDNDTKIEIEVDDPLERTRKQVERLQNFDNNPEEEDDDEFILLASASIETLTRELSNHSANGLKNELKNRRLDTKGRKPDLSRRLAMDILRRAQRLEEEEEVVEEVKDVVEVKVGMVTMEEEEGRKKMEKMMASSDISKKIKEEVVQQVQQQQVQQEQSKQQPPTTTPTTTNPKIKIQSGTSKRFAGIRLPPYASQALLDANFSTPTPIQTVALPHLRKGNSALLHAETGSGKTLCYLLPLVAQMCGDDYNGGTGLILTPTRELAAQVAGVVQALTPPGMVRFVAYPSNLDLNLNSMDLAKEDSSTRHLIDAGNNELGGGNTKPRIIVASAKTIQLSLFGDDSSSSKSGDDDNSNAALMAPTTKPNARAFLQSISYLVLDEADRILASRVDRSSKSKRYKRHERPGAIVTASIARRTLGQVQVVAASATVGRGLRREMARVLGLVPSDCPPVLRGGDHDDASGSKDNNSAKEEDGNGAVRRAVTVPSSVQHFVLPCAGEGGGALLSTAALAIRHISSTSTSTTPTTTSTTSTISSHKILVVLTRTCGMRTKDAIGALRHLGIRSDVSSLADALDDNHGDGGPKGLVAAHRQASGVTGLGQNCYTNTNTDNENENDSGYVLVTTEDSIRGLHLDGLDTVIVVGRTAGPDEYSHVAGRTGRAGNKGSVINVLEYEHVPRLNGWENMLGVSFVPMEV